MKKKSITILAVTLVSSLLLFTGCKHHSSRGSAFMLDYISESLDLRPEQEQELSGIRDELQAEVKRIHEENDQLYETLKAQLASEVIDRSIVRQQIADHRSRMDEVIDLAVDRLADFHATLTPEQRLKLVAKMEKFKERRDSHFHR